MSVISVGEHRDVAVGPGDMVVFSARPIPGNERAVSRVIGNLFRRGCDVVHGGIAAVHVSGHASRDELVELIQRVRPRYLVPIHGEYRMLAQHARLAVEAGMPADHVLLAEDGEVLAFGPDGARKEGTVPAGRILLDRSGAEELEEVVVRDRRHLSSDGIVVPVVVLDKQTGRLQSAPEIVTRGFVDSGGHPSSSTTRPGWWRSWWRRGRPRSSTTPTSPASACAWSCGGSSAGARSGGRW